jgi:hypothetical protein
VQTSYALNAALLPHLNDLSMAYVFESGAYLAMLRPTAGAAPK